MLRDVATAGEASRWAGGGHTSCCHASPSVSSPAIHQFSHSLHRYRFRVALFTSLAAAWLHHHSGTRSTPEANTSSSSTLSRNRIRTTRRLVSLGDGDGLLPRASQGRRSHVTSSRRSAFSGGHTSTTRRLSTSRALQSVSKEESTSQREAKSLEDERAGSSTSTAEEATDIVRLMRHPELLTDIKKPRNPIVLCHGLYGFDVRGPFWGLEIHYWASILDILRKKVGAEVIVRGVPGTGAIAERAEELHKFLASPDAGIQGKKINFIGHSMGGLDARHIISVIKPKREEYHPVSLTTLSTPHRGSPFMDWCNANVGTGNDRVEAEIKQAKKKLAEQGRATTGGMQDASGEAEEDVKKLPYSLKSPLFVRPAKAKSVETNEGISDAGDLADVVQDSVKEMATKVVSSGSLPDAITPSSDSGNPGSRESSSSSPVATSSNSKADVSKKKEKSSPLLNLSIFNKALSSIGGSFSSYLLGVIDQPAYAMLSTRYMSQVFNPSVPNSPDVAYFSVAARKRSLAIWHPLWLPKLVLDAAAESRSAGGERDGSGDALGSQLQGNDGLVSVESAKWGTFLGVIEGCDHWDLRGGGAPRWRGRVNPSTGKPWPEKIDEEKEKKKEKSEKDKSWIDVNTILGKILNRSKAEAPAEKEKATTPAAREEGKGDADAKTTKPMEEDGMLDEVASWISDRLPQGDESRRAEAERVADEQDRKDRRYQEASQSERAVLDEIDRIDAEVKKLEADVKKDAMARKQNKLRRDAAWQEELGHDGAARELRRELAWHRGEWDRYTSSTDSQADSGAATKAPRPYPYKRELDWDRHSKRKQEGEADKDRKKQKSEEANELERFWLAVCRHLYNQGF